MRFSPLFALSPLGCDRSVRPVFLLRRLVLFGYVKCYLPELRMREYEYYKGIYCGLCRSMGRCTGNLSRLTLSYDFVFLALTRMALTGEAPRFEAKRCIVHPFRRRPSCVSCDATEFAAKASAILAWHNLSDDIGDSGGIRRLPHLIVRPFFAHARKRASDFSSLDARVEEELRAFRLLEKSGDVSVDALADSFGSLLSAVFGDGLPERQRRIASEIGFHVGRWIYFVDAVDDYEKDVRRGEFNPFSASGLPSDDVIRSSLTAEMAATETAVELLSDSAEPEIIELIKNILYLGTEKIISDILKKRKEKAVSQSEEKDSGGSASRDTDYGEKVSGA